MRKRGKTGKDERKTRREASRDQEGVGTVREGTTTISGKSRKELQTKPMKNNHTP
jgi:hypothetical protein